ncbi:hypothetical protein MBLNU459_g0073t1 [Dothideomycetes sp. NU459]
MDYVNLGTPKQLWINVGLCIALTATTWLTTVLRGYVRLFILRSWGWDDWMQLIALFCATVFFGLSIFASIFATRHMAGISQSDLEKLLNYIRISALFYTITQIFLKIALALFFLRFVIEKWQRRLMIGVTVVYTSYTVAFNLFLALQCKVLNKGPTGVKSKCGSWSTLGSSTTSGPASISYLTGPLLWPQSLFYKEAKCLPVPRSAPPSS